MWHGDYTIASGVISPAVPLKNGQRFMIVGSDLNDGIYTYYDEAIMNDDDSVQAELVDEVFSGSIAAMAVPKAFLDAVHEADEWKAANKAALDNPYTSESVQGVYSYTKNSALSDDTNALGLPAHLSASFERWRKPCQI